MEGGDVMRPENTILVVILFDGSCDNAGYADSVAAHKGMNREIVFSQYCGVHGPGVFVSKLENVSDFNTSTNTDFSFFVGSQVTGTGQSQVGGFKFGNIP